MYKYQQNNRKCQQGNVSADPYEK